MSVVVWLIPCWYGGARDAWSANDFMRDLAPRMARRVQLTTDGLKAYIRAVKSAFGADVDYAMLVSCTVLRQVAGQNVATIRANAAEQSTAGSNLAQRSSSTEALIRGRSNSTRFASGTSRCSQRS
jgi:hypothetical protein